MTRFALALFAVLLLGGSSGCCCCLCREVVYWKKVHCNPCGDFCPCPYGYDGCGYCGDDRHLCGGHGCGCDSSADCGPDCGECCGHGGGRPRGLLKRLWGGHSGEACGDCGCDSCADCGPDCGECCGHGGGHHCGLFKRLWGRHCCEAGCGEAYWGDWHGEPADCCCDPCDHWGNWTGPHHGHYGPYHHRMPAPEAIIEEGEPDELPPPPPAASQRPAPRRA